MILTFRPIKQWPDGWQDAWPSTVQRSVPRPPHGVYVTLDVLGERDRYERLAHRRPFDWEVD